MLRLKGFFCVCVCRQDSRLLHCDPVRNKASVLLGLTHAVKASHTHTHTFRHTNTQEAHRERQACQQRRMHTLGKTYTKKTDSHMAHAYCIVHFTVLAQSHASQCFLSHCIHVTYSIHVLLAVIFPHADPWVCLCKQASNRWIDRQVHTAHTRTGNWHRNRTKQSKGSW